jgi:hypothetical protein
MGARKVAYPDMTEMYTVAPESKAQGHIGSAKRVVCEESLAIRLGEMEKGKYNVCYGMSV